jgi:hypothetical protein
MYVSSGPDQLRAMHYRNELRRNRERIIEAAVRKLELRRTQAAALDEKRHAPGGKPRPPIR